MNAAPVSIIGRRVLVVDDHPDSADASCMLLSTLGHVCSSAMSGEEALALAARFQPDVVICDIGLPDISGYEVARALRSRHGSRVYLAALTGWVQPADRARSFAAGFDQHLIKPAGGRVLREVIAASVRNIAVGTGEFPILERKRASPDKDCTVCEACAAGSARESCEACAALRAKRKR